ncbi:Helix-turn-helix domain [uncultured Ruminococcus sp.]|nr:Helix-turn-helix domain [uncultured Ruminococcus sp.]
MKTLFTMEECAEQIGKSSRTIQRYLKNGTLERVIKKTKKGRERYITVASVARYIRNESEGEVNE